ILQPRPSSTLFPYTTLFRSAVAQGCILCGETFMEQKKSSDAVKIYDVVRHAELPQQRILEATRGAILARGSAGLPLLMEQLASRSEEHTSELQSRGQLVCRL